MSAILEVSEQTQEPRAAGTLTNPGRDMMSRGRAAPGDSAHCRGGALRCSPHPQKCGGRGAPEPQLAKGTFL